MRRVVGVALALAACAARATGPSTAEVRIAPIAVSATGVVLFKTWRELNPEGSRGAQPAEVGWLVVSGDGLWREVPHAAVDPRSQREEAEYYRLLKEFRAELDWTHPPLTVRPLLAEFGFTVKHRVAADLGKGAVTWSPRKLCLRAKCTEWGIKQWAPGGVLSEDNQGKPIAAEFYAAGVALFRQRLREGEAWEPLGAVFRLPPHRYWDEREGLVDLGYELQLVDGISIVPKALRAP